MQEEYLQLPSLYFGLKYKYKITTNEYSFYFCHSQDFSLSILNRNVRETEFKSQNKQLLSKYNYQEVLQNMQVFIAKY